MDMPRTRYARSGAYHIAYQVVGGGGAQDLVLAPGFASHVELCWENPAIARLLSGLARFSRLIVFDKRGTGLSDRVPHDKLPTLEERAGDLLAVMDAARSQRAAVFGVSEGGLLAFYFAASHPARTQALVTWGAYARRVWSDSYPWAPKPDMRDAEIAWVEANWGDPDAAAQMLAQYEPTMAGDADYARRQAAYFRSAASPGAAAALLRMNTGMDVRHLLGSIRAPAMIMHRTGDRDVMVDEGRWIASQIPGARFSEWPGDDHVPWRGQTDEILAEIEEFLTGRRSAPPPTRALMSILFTDVVGSTEKARAMGDDLWSALLTRLAQIGEAIVEGHGGRALKDTGDGMLATFGAPGRAVEAARALLRAAEPLGIELRAGLHVGECEIRGDDISGVAVHLAARVAGVAGPREIRATRTVRDLVAGSGLTFEDERTHRFKGFDDDWTVYRVATGASAA